MKQDNKPNPIASKGARVQMADVARAAGVSAATVSRALSGNASIPEATRLRITEVAQRLGYRIHHGAANLRRRDSSTVGVVVLADDEQPISDPFILGMIGQIADALNKRGRSLLLTRVQKDHQAAMAALVSSGQLSGLLVIGQAKYHQLLNELEDKGTPLVVWGAVLGDGKYSVVGGDNTEGGYLATKHLLDNGARQIGFFGDVRYPEVKMRYQGYLRAHKEAKVVANKLLCSQQLYNAKEVAHVIDGWLDQNIPFDAVFATSDVAAANVLAALATRNVKVPKQVQVVGYDDVPLSMQIYPQLTTIRQPLDLAAEALVDLLMEKIAGDASRAVILEAQLVKRKSTR